MPGSNVYSRCNNRHSRILHSHMFCDTGRCRASIFA
ncbi:antirestriction protein, partial [Shigella sonnei]|nr:antirestriction protein [Shigella sonnei]EFX4538519.1 antirestriction protein [Shigella flexneri]